MEIVTRSCLLKDSVSEKFMENLAFSSTKVKENGRENVRGRTKSLDSQSMDGNGLPSDGNNSLEKTSGQHRKWETPETSVKPSAISKQHQIHKTIK